MHQPMSSTRTIFMLSFLIINLKETELEIGRSLNSLTRQETARSSVLRLYKKKKKANEYNYKNSKLYMHYVFVQINTSVVIC